MPKTSCVSFRASGATHSGTKRTKNEDRFVNRIDLGLWAVADGVGGHSGGEIAADLVAQRLESTAPSLPLVERGAWVRAVLTQVDHELTQHAKANGSSSGPATTIVVVVAEQNAYLCLWAGDSRAYRLRDRRLEQITRDHSLVQKLVEMGALTPSQAEGHALANVITRGIGLLSKGANIDEVKGGLLPGDLLLLCSDGLFKALDESEITEILIDDQDASDALFQAALTRSATDNVTALTIWCLAD